MSNKNNKHGAYKKRRNKLWLARPEWAGNRISCEYNSNVIFAWIGVVFVFAFSVPILMIVPEAIDEQKYLPLIGLFFPAAGVLMLYQAIDMTRQWRKFGNLNLVMDPFPGSIGGQVGGRILLPLAYSPEYKFHACLACFRRYIKYKRNDNNKWQQEMIWQTKGMAYTKPVINGTSLELCFEVPNGVPESEEESDDYRFWRLSIAGFIPGVDLERSFDIPVYDTGGQKSRQQRLSVEHPDFHDFQYDLIYKVMNVKQVVDGVELHCPMLRNISGWLYLLIAGLVFTGFSAVNAYAGSGLLRWVLIPLSLVIGFLLIFFSLKSIFYSINSKIDGKGITVCSYWMGIPLKTCHVSRNEVKRLFVMRKLIKSSGSGDTAICQICAETEMGRIFPVAINIRGLQTAELALEAVSGLAGHKPFVE